MRRSFLSTVVIGVSIALGAFSSNSVTAGELDKILSAENGKLGIDTEPMPLAGDLAFLRRISVDLISRIPSHHEIDQYLAWSKSERRQKLVEKLMADSRFNDRWTVFFSDMLRLRSNSPGGSSLIAYVHNALKEQMPYDELSRRLISINGKANATPEVGFILGDDAEPMALASATSQIFMGVRMGCAQCHDHPFDVWTQKDFYGLAAYFGKTRRVETRFTKVVYTTETSQMKVMWPPEGEAESEDRKPMRPTFPIKYDKDETPDFVARLNTLRERLEREKAKKHEAEHSIDDLLASSESKARLSLGGNQDDATTAEAKSEIRKINLKESMYQRSKLREELADLVTDPRNKYFTQAIVNRVWKELIGRAFVEPVDDFCEDNTPIHPAVLNYLSEEFVANNFNFRWLVKEIISSDVYARSHAPDEAGHMERQELEDNFLATPMRRMISESLFDSIVTAGHLFEMKYLEGENIKVAFDTIRVPKKSSGGEEDGKSIVEQVVGDQGTGEEMTQMEMAAMNTSASGYALEQAIELDFTALLNQKDDGVEVDEMKFMSSEEIEAQRMMEMEQKQPANKKRTEYVTKTVKREYDDNPRFTSSLRMASPAPLGHFLRVFGQPGREELGDLREDNASMRQALMMLNGRLTHEASRVGTLEPIYSLLVGKKADMKKAVRLAYRDILTREPTASEVKEGVSLLGDEPLGGMSDLRWVLLNCNEFRFLP